jgi:CHAD domain-containing protein
MARSPDPRRELFRRLTAQARRTVRTPDAEQVHNLRVAIRRFNQAAALAQDASGLKKTRKHLKKAMELAGRVRDADITMKLVAKLRPAGTSTLQEKLARRRAEREQRLIAALPKIAAQLEIGKPSLEGKPPQVAISAAAERLFERGSKADDARGLHRLRIAAKKLRYTLELLAPEHARMDQIKRLQSLLGDINDYETARRIIAEESGAKTLAAQFEDRQRKKIREFRSYWKSDFERAGEAREWLAELPQARTAA